jgi:hypothetical protein
MGRGSSEPNKRFIYPFFFCFTIKRCFLDDARLNQMDYFYTEGEENRLLEILSELENHPSTRRLDMPIKRKINEMFCMHEESNDPEYEKDDHTERFRHERLKFNYKWSHVNILTAMAELLLIAEKQGYTYSFAETGSPLEVEMTRAQGILGYFKAVDEADEKWRQEIVEPSRQSENKLVRQIAENYQESGILMTSIAKLQKSGDTVYFAYVFKNHSINLLFIRKDSPDYLETSELDIFSDICFDPRPEIKEFFSLKK